MKKNKILSLTVAATSALQIFSPLSTHSLGPTIKDKIQRELNRIIKFRPDLSKTASLFLSSPINQGEAINYTSLELKLKKCIDSDNYDALVQLFNDENLYDKNDLSIPISYMFELFPKVIPLTHYCALKGRVSCLKFLLNLDQDVTARKQVKMSSVGWDAMAFAVAFNQKNIIDVLENFEMNLFSNPGVWEAASITYRNEFLYFLLNYKTEDSQRCINAALFGAIKSHNLKGLKLILPQVENLNDIRDANDEFAPLHVAAIEGLSDVAKVLLENGADPNIKSKNTQTTALHFANDTKLVDLLIDNGANINSADHLGCTKLHQILLSLDHSEDLAKHIISKCDNTDNNQKSFLYAMVDKDISAAKTLIENGLNVNKPIPDFDNATLLHLAAYYELPEFIDLICNVNGADLNAKDNNGKTPLHMSTPQYSSYPFIKLLEYGANYFIRDNNGNLPNFYIDSKHRYLIEKQSFFNQE